MNSLSILEAKPAIRRVSSDFTGDEAVELEMLEARIGISRAARNKSERDALLMALAMSALKDRVNAYTSETGKRYPNFDEIARWIENTSNSEKIEEAHKIADSTMNTDQPRLLAHERESSDQPDNGSEWST